MRHCRCRRYPTTSEATGSGHAASKPSSTATPAHENHRHTHRFTQLRVIESSPARTIFSTRELWLKPFDATAVSPLCWASSRAALSTQTRLDGRRNAPEMPSLDRPCQGKSVRPVKCRKVNGISPGWHVPVVLPPEHYERRPGGILAV